MNEQRMCSTCKLCWKSEPNKETLKRDFFCRRNPPVPMAMVGPMGPVVISNFPTVHPEMWCGEWVKRDVELAVANTLPA